MTLQRASAPGIHDERHLPGPRCDLGKRAFCATWEHHYDPTADDGCHAPHGLRAAVPRAMRRTAFELQPLAPTTATESRAIRPRLRPLDLAEVVAEMDDDVLAAAVDYAAWRIV